MTISNEARTGALCVTRQATRPISHCVSHMLSQDTLVSPVYRHDSLHVCFSSALFLRSLRKGQSKRKIFSYRPRLSHKLMPAGKGALEKTTKRHLVGQLRPCLPAD